MKTSRIKNRIAKIKRGTAYPVFVGVFWALAAWELATLAVPIAIRNIIASPLWSELINRWA
jgi:hypothetical protein